MKIALIAAIGKHRELGQHGRLPWHLPNDLKFFKDTTLHHHIITGRKNYESIPEKFRPLSGRVNIIITKNKWYTAASCIVTHSLEEALDAAKKNGESEAFIIGGGEIFQQAFDKNLPDTLYITHIDAVFPQADVFFPKTDLKNWHKKILREYPADLLHPYRFSICQYTRKKTIQECG